MMQVETYTDKVFRAYVDCAIWSSTDGEHPLDENFGPDDLTVDALDSMRADVNDFCEDNWDDVSHLDPEQVGHDFWLTRNGHGAGFWDRGLGELGDRLAAATRPYGSSDLYVGDDGLLYVY